MTDTLVPVLTHGHDHVRAIAVGREIDGIRAAVQRLRDAIADIDQPIDMRDAGRLGEMRAAVMSIEHSIETVDVNLGRLQIASLGPNT